MLCIAQTTSCFPVSPAAVQQRNLAAGDEIPDTAYACIAAVHFFSEDSSARGVPAALQASVSGYRIRVPQSSHFIHHTSYCAASPGKRSMFRALGRMPAVKLSASGFQARAGR